MKIEREKDTTINGIFYDFKFSKFIFFCVFQLSLIELENDRAVWLTPSWLKPQVKPTKILQNRFLRTRQNKIRRQRKFLIVQEPKVYSNNVPLTTSTRATTAKAF